MSGPLLIDDPLLLFVQLHAKPTHDASLWINRSQESRPRRLSRRSIITLRKGKSPIRARAGYNLRVVGAGGQPVAPGVEGQDLGAPRMPDQAAADDPIDSR